MATGTAVQSGNSVPGAQAKGAIPHPIEKVGRRHRILMTCPACGIKGWVDFGPRGECAQCGYPGPPPRVLVAKLKVNPKVLAIGLALVAPLAVAVSSLTALLGLTVADQHLFPLFLDMVIGMWSASLIADLVFVAGTFLTVAAGIGVLVRSWRKASRGHRIAGLLGCSLIGLLGTALTYSLAYLAAFLEVSQREAAHHAGGASNVLNLDMGGVAFLFFAIVVPASGYLGLATMATALPAAGLVLAREAVAPPDSWQKPYQEAAVTGRGLATERAPGSSMGTKRDGRPAAPLTFK